MIEYHKENIQLDDTLYYPQNYGWGVMLYSPFGIYDATYLNVNVILSGKGAADQLIPVVT